MTIEDHRQMQDWTPHAAPPATRHEADTKTGSGAVMLTAGGLIAAFGAAACCGLPLVLAGLAHRARVFGSTLSDILAGDSAPILDRWSRPALEADENRVRLERDLRAPR